jgi:disulfide bond formation protein DsbB
MSQQNPSDNSFPLVPALIFFGGIALILLAVFANRPANSTMNTTPTPVVIAAANPPAQNVASTSSGLDPAKISAGESTFQTICSACHGFNAMGISGLGKPLVGSQFVNGKTDDELLAFLQVGRPVTDPLNTTGVMMPARGGNPNLKDSDLLNVIAYIRSLNGAEVAAPSAEQIAAAAAQPTLPPAEFQAGAISALLGTSSTSASAESTEVAVAPTTAPIVNTFASPGAADYVAACAGCHGLNDEGVPMLTKPLSDSELLKNMNSIGIMNLFTTAHPPTVEFQHPYRGGYPELSDNQLLGIITYLMTQH